MGKGMLVLLGCLCCLLLVRLTDGQTQWVNVEALVDARTPIATVDPNFLCATLDWWPPQKCDYGTCSWNHASLLNLDLTNPVFINAVKALSPLKIRLGGTLQDRMNYDMRQQAANACAPFAPSSSGLFGFSDGCLSKARWDELNHFFNVTGSEVAFGLNALYGRPPGGAWNSSNAREFIQYTADRGYNIRAWELGNEVWWRIPGKQYAADMLELHSIVKEIYTNKAIKPILVAPDGYFDWNWCKEFFQASGPDVVNVFSHHIYSLGPANSTDLVEKILDPTYLDKEAATFDVIKKALQQLAPWAVSWVGEAGGAYNSGRHLVTDAFISGFWFVDQMGMAATYGTKSYCRQSLIGGNYGLLDGTTFRPNPDYYSVLLWQRLMGTKVLRIHSSSGESHLRFYSHCSKDNRGVTLVLLNLSKDSGYKVTISLDGLASNVSSIAHPGTPSNVGGSPPATSGATTGKPQRVFRSNPKRSSWFKVQQQRQRRRQQEVSSFNDDSVVRRQEFHISAKGGDFHSQSVMVNGELLSEGGQIPQLTPVWVDMSSPVSLAPLCIAFVSFPTEVLACK